MKNSYLLCVMRQKGMYGILQNVLCYSTPTTEAQKGCQHDFAPDKNQLSGPNALDCTTCPTYHTPISSHSDHFKHADQRLHLGKFEDFSRD